MYNILISAVGGDIGQGLLKSLRLVPGRARIIGCDMNPDTPGLFLCDRGYLVAGAVNNPDKYIQDIVRICKKEKVDIVFSPQPFELDVLSGQGDYLRKKTGSYFVVQPPAVWSLCADKLLTYRFLSKQGWRVPETYETKAGFDLLKKKYGLPLVVKPRKSSGSRHVYLVNNRGEFSKAWKMVPLPIVQEHVSNKKGDEYTVGVFLDKNSKSLGAIPMLRQLRFGLTVHAIVDDYPQISSLAQRAAESIGAVGPCNVQLRLDRNEEPCIIEINARISSTAVFRAHLGFNEAQACIDYFLKHKNPSLKYHKGVAMKTWGELILPIKKYQDLKKRKFI